MSKSVITIGVYDWDLDSFLEALRRADVRLLLDVRQRRGVRGPRYAWANSQRLQQALAGAGIAYEHHKELAPTTELRHLQYEEDARQGVGKRSRVELAPEYRERYQREILDHVDLGAIARGLPAEGTTALLCVERDPEACHRSMIADELARDHGIAVGHLRP
ncbi:MAG TPA: DUF488 domain-containing protein [Solirubrobacteraceae bacterium]